MRRFLAAFWLSAACLFSGCLVQMDPMSPNVEPVANPEFRCLVQFEAKKQHTYSEKQQQVLIGGIVRDYLKKKCVIGEDGKTPDFRFLDKDLPLDGVWLQLATQANAKKPTSDADYPWVYCSNGTTGLSAPITKETGPDQFIQLIKPIAEP